MYADPADRNFGTPTPEHETLLFLHGWGAPTAVYPRLLSFIGEYLPVIAPDLPGFGGTDEPETPWGVSEYADFVLHFAEKLGLQKVLLMGHSHGGRVSIEIASRDTLPFALTRLVLMDAAGVLPKKTFRQKLRQRQYKICRAVLETGFCRALYPDALENLRRSHGSADYLNATPLMRQTLVKCVNTDMTAFGRPDDGEADPRRGIGDHPRRQPFPLPRGLGALFPGAGQLPVIG